jgi:hypothetical protein
MSRFTAKLGFYGAMEAQDCGPLQAVAVLPDEVAV